MCLEADRVRTREPFGGVSLLALTAGLWALLGLWGLPAADRPSDRPATIASETAPNDGVPDRASRDVVVGAALATSSVVDLDWLAGFSTRVLRDPDVARDASWDLFETHTAGLLRPTRAVAEPPQLGLLVSAAALLVALTTIRRSRNT